MSSQFGRQLIGFFHTMWIRRVMTTTDMFALFTRSTCTSVGSDVDQLGFDARKSWYMKILHGNLPRSAELNAIIHEEAEGQRTSNLVAGMLEIWQLIHALIASGDIYHKAPVHTLPYSRRRTTIELARKQTVKVFVVYPVNPSITD
ncbi:hypothetical protein L195_g039663, partial [Trifolium pratense]